MGWPLPKFVLYAAQFALEPFDDRRADERAAVSTALLIKAFCGEWVDPAKMFKSLEASPAQQAAAAAAEKKHVGQGFFLWAKYKLASQVAQIDGRPTV